MRLYKCVCVVHRMPFASAKVNVYFANREKWNGWQTHGGESAHTVNREKKTQTKFLPFFFSINACACACAS